MSTLTAPGSATETSADSAPKDRHALQATLVRVGVLTVVVVLLALLIYPISRMVIKALAPEGVLDLSAFARVTQSEWFWDVMRDTLLVVGSSAVIALVIGAVLAWLNERTDAGLGWLGGFMPLMPLLVPPIATAAGWYFLAAPDVGFLNGLLHLLPGNPQVNVLTVPGLVFVYVLEMIPYAYITISGALRNLDPALEEASRVSGAGLVKTLFRVSLPAVSQSIVSAFFLLVVVGFAIYSAPVVIGTNAGINILSVEVVKLMQFTYPADLQSATVLTTVLLGFVLSAWALQQVVTSRGRFAMISGRSGQGKVGLGKWRHPLRALMLVYLGFTTVVPIIALLIVSLQPFWTPVIDPAHFTLRHFASVFGRGNSTTALQTSVTLGVVGGAIAVAICVLIAIAKRRTSYGFLIGRRLARLVDGVMRLPAALSHIVIGLGFIVAFSGPPFNWNGTLIILLLCYLVAFMPQATTTTSNALSQIGNELTEASYMSHAGEMRTNTRVILPLAIPGLLSAWALMFVLFASEISASVMLAGARTPVIGFVLVDIWENGTVGPMAAFALVVTVITSTAVLILLLAGRQKYRVRR
ncbi:iron ABC transporter permease [Microbacterium pseudoresistens]|uniref:Iron(III) transport system permease protein n=1 Tax=Microbacterium pseudoresistens TaxID=640634 RepID=A0A7Y9JMC5_9MICO|nr:iron ABC transporter permease [Microbacterium pseudoresistens]NYD54250.1 iron(III) transport system permease protein [Microbacterium pseudoresistens]